MTPLDQELLDISLEALVKHKQEINKTKEEVATTNKVIKDVKDSLKSDISKISDNLLTIDKNIPNLVKKEIAKIPIPKDGAKGKDGKSIRGPKGKDGKDGKSIVGPKGTPGKDGKDGKTIKGDKGKDGVGIKDIKAKDEKLEIKLTNGDIKKVHIPVRNHKDYSNNSVVKLGSIYQAKDTYVPNPVDGQALVYDNSTKKWIAKSLDQSANTSNTEFLNRIEIEDMFKKSEHTAYKELTYTDDNITNIDIYVDANKTIKLFSKVIGYNNGNITSISITDETNGGTLSKTIAYTNGKVSSVTTEYTA